MSKQLRLHVLAKQLGIDSKEIIRKCAAEGIELKNHMAMVPLGLAESIKEWFSAGADVTSVEVAAPVDLTSVKKTRRRKAASEGDESAVGTATAEPSADETTVEAEAEPLPVESPAPREEPVETPVLAPAARVEEPPVENKPIVVDLRQVAEERRQAEAAAVAAAAAAAAAPEEAPAAPVEIAAKVEPAAPPVAPPPPPPVIRPAGPQVTPAPAVLQGPRVVRIEAPEPVRAPRPRSPGGGGDWRPGGGPGGPGPGRGPARGPVPVPPPVPGRSTAARKDDERDRKQGARSPRRHHDSDLLFDERMREWKDQDVLERKERLAAATGQGLRIRRTAERRRQMTPGPQPTVGKRGPIEVTVPITVKDFCAASGTTFKAVSMKLMQSGGKLLRINDMLDAETIELLSAELGVPIEIVQARTALEALEDSVEDRERLHLEPRPPVVCILGHVDHGKTSLLDAIRRTSVAAGEAGGITQHIGAYRIKKGEWDVTFLDTPGHEAFTAMRARGAQMTDVVVLVVAATDGVMPQTVEAINHAKAAGVQIVVALNKIDVPNIDLNKVYGQLAENELTPTEWGGSTDVIKTSATKNIGIDDLVSHLSTLSEVMELTADATVPAVATVIEAQMKEGRGVVAEVLVREGTLKPGQFVVCGPGYGKVRSLIDDKGERVDSAGPATPVEVLGLDELPRAGDKLYVVEDLSAAKEIAEEVRTQRRQESLRTVRKSTLEDLLRGGDTEEVPELNAIIKADVQGSVESLKVLLGKFPSTKAKLRILHAGVGAVTEADVTLAQTSQAVIIGFNVVADDRARSLADQAGVEVRTYRVIYDIEQDLLRALEGLLAPQEQQQYRGKAEVLQVFNVSKAGTIAGCRVVDGVIGRSHRVRLIRDGRIVLDGSPIGSLRRVKDDVKEVRSGFECGIKIESFDDLKPGDVIEAYETIEVRQQL
ncbi:MAG: translation initiation factor IF-2 [Phycisphaerales bacterium]|nr:translation initiation factor IF-2 [Phycisphaerales bacterium]